jgi:hypothetical protein
MDKCCTRCKETKPLSDFFLDYRYSPPRHRARCKPCRVFEEWLSRNENDKFAKYCSILPGYKECTGCGIIKKLDQFPQSTNNFHCLECKADEKRKNLEKRLKIESFLFVFDGFKYCSKCEKVKLVEEFHYRKDAKVGVRAHCKNCVNLSNIRWTQSNPDKIQQIQIRHMQKPSARLARRLRIRIRQALNRTNSQKMTPTDKLLGCSFDFFKNYFESLFTDGMNWEEFFEGNIHVGHIKPCCSFDLTTPGQQKECFNYKNLRPEWWRENLQKCAEDRKLSVW